MERLINLPQVTQLINGRGKSRNRVVCLQSMLSPLGSARKRLAFGTLGKPLKSSVTSLSYRNNDIYCFLDLPRSTETPWKGGGQPTKGTKLDSLQLNLHRNPDKTSLGIQTL